jgi:hypothetical protein
VKGFPHAGQLTSLIFALGFVTGHDGIHPGKSTSQAIGSVGSSPSPSDHPFADHRKNYQEEGDEWNSSLHRASWLTLLLTPTGPEPGGQ